MEKIDIRKLSPDEQYRLRKIVVRLREKGKSNKEIAEKVAICPTHISTIWQKYLRGGLDSLKPRVRGRKEGKILGLSAEQEMEVIKLLIDKTPDALELGSHLWTRKAIQLAIKLVIEHEEQEKKVEIPLRTITDYLRRWGISPQKPIKLPNKQSSEAYKEWQELKYPEIIARVVKEKLEIVWVNWNKVEVKGVKPSRVYMISAITNKGQMRFMLYRRKITIDSMLCFIIKLIKEYKLMVIRNEGEQALFLIVPSNKIFETKEVQSILKRYKKVLEIEYI